jgi:hypothetical protein
VANESSSRSRPGDVHLSDFHQIGTLVSDPRVKHGGIIAVDVVVVVVVFIVVGGRGGGSRGGGGVVVFGIVLDVCRRAPRARTSS